MKFYLIRHRPSGLFYKPNAKAYDRENLDEHGKVYWKKPRIPRDASSRKLNGGSRKLLEEDFEIWVCEAQHVDTL